MTRITQLKRPCPVCGGKRAQALYLNELAAVDGLDVSYRLSRCIRCGFHFASELPAESDYLRYYQTLSKYDAQPSPPRQNCCRPDRTR